MLASSLPRSSRRSAQTAVSSSQLDEQPSRLLVIDRAHPDRLAVESFIQTIYAACHGARVRHFMPTLVALRDGEGMLLAAAGYRDAGEQPLFLERYLDRPVERLLAAGGAPLPARARIVEVGQLVAAQAGQGRRLILQLGPHLAAQGFDWVVGTLTRELRHLFTRLGIAPMALGIADPALLGAEAADWGSYYEHHPLVVAGQIAPALQVLMQRRSGT